MKMSKAAKFRSGQVWIEMWLSASTEDATDPAIRREVVEMPVQDRRAGSLRRFPQRVIDMLRIAEV